MARSSLRGFWRMRRFPLRKLLFFFAAFACLRALRAQFHVSPVYGTGTIPSSNVDSAAVWVAPQGLPSLLFVTEKDGDHVEVWNASTGAAYSPKPFLGGPVDASGPGELNRPNGVWVLYHVPFAGGFTDILLVTDQLNERVEVFRLPELEYFGEFGKGQVGKGYGIAWYQDGTDFFVFITDQVPPAAFPGKIKKFRLRPEGNGLGADLVFGVGSASGNPPLPNVESIVADFPLNRLHVCGDEGGKFNRVFRLDGTYTDTIYGDPQFEFDQEGINLYDTGNAQGYLIVSDQHTDGTPNQFELFDRVTLASLGNFESPAGGALVTRNTDGAYLEHRPFLGFPNGMFCAVNDDKNCHAYDWTDIAAAMGLEIVAVDRPFEGRAVGAPGSTSPSRSGLWFHDGSWWGALNMGENLSIARLEDGTFARMGSLGPPSPAMAWSEGEALFVLSAGPAARVLAFDYQASQRRYVPRAEGAPIGAVSGSLVDFTVETTGQGGVVRGWVAWVNAGEIWVSSSDADLMAWDKPGFSLGPARSVLPRLLRLPAATGLLWAEPGGVSFRLHPDASAPGSWTPREVVSSLSLESLAAAALPDGSVLATGGDSSGAGTIWKRGPGSWAGAPLPGQTLDPALVIDPDRARAHLFHAAEVSGHRVLQHREASLADLAFEDGPLLVGWPGVDQQELLAPVFLPPEAEDLVVASSGSDGFGYFGRVFLPGGTDRQAPITLQHAPAPGENGVAEGSTLFFRLTDDKAGLDRAKLKLFVNGAPVTPQVRGAARNVVVTYELPAGLGGLVGIRIEAADLAVPSHVMTPFEYEFSLGAAAAPRFERGDANADGRVDISDAVKTLLFLFGGGAPIPCGDAGDANDDDAVNVSDAIYVLAYLFTRGIAPLPPSPGCGFDPTPDSLGCSTQTACN